MKFSVPTDMGPMEVEAAECGAFLIHPPPARIVTLTHARSGSRITDCCCRASAEALASELARFDWDYDPDIRNGKAQVPHRLAAEKKQIAQIVRGWKCPRGCQ